jgi:hypothetical protein
MPIQIIVPEGVLTPSAEAEAFRKLTELLLRLHGLTGNTFMTPNVIGEVTVAPNGRTFSGGKPTEIAIFELKVPSFVLPTQELKDTWIWEGTTIIEQATAGRIKRENIYSTSPMPLKAPGSAAKPTATPSSDRLSPRPPDRSSTGHVRKSRRHSRRDRYRRYLDDYTAVRQQPCRHPPPCAARPSSQASAPPPLAPRR